MRRERRWASWALQSLHRYQAKVERVESVAVPNLGKKATPESAGPMLRAFLSHEPGEVIGALLLNGNSEVLGVTFAPTRRLRQARVDVGALFQVVLLTHGRRIMGFRWAGADVDARDSDEDRRLTKRLISAGSVLGVFVDDFLIVSSGPGQISLKQSWPAWPEMAQWSAPLVEPRRRMPVKYRDPATGETWHGGGSTPRWLRERLDQGFDLEDFRVQD